MLGTGQEGYTNTVGLWELSDKDRNGYMRVCGEQSTITKMHWLKLDPYRYQTES